MYQNIKPVLAPRSLLSKHVLTESILSVIHSHNAIHIATDSIYGTHYATADTRLQFLMLTTGIFFI